MCSFWAIPDAAFAELHPINSHRMMHAYALSFTTLRSSLALILGSACCVASAQTTIVPQSVSASLEPFSSATVATNLTLNHGSDNGEYHLPLLPEQQLHQRHRLRQ